MKQTTQQIKIEKYLEDYLNYGNTKIEPFYDLMETKGIPRPTVRKFVFEYKQRLQAHFEVLNQNQQPRNHYTVKK